MSRALPPNMENAFRQAAIVKEPVSESIVCIALQKEFQHLVYVYENWDTCKKKDRRKNKYNPDEAAKKSAAALAERIAAEKSLLAKGATKPSSTSKPDPAAADNFVAPALAEKRSRVVSEAPKSTGGSVLPAETLSPAKPRTKAARTRGRNLKEQAAQLEAPAPAVPEIAAECLDTTVAVVAEIPADERMAAPDDDVQDDTVMAAEEGQAGEVPDAENIPEVLPEVLPSASGEPAESENQSPPGLVTVTPSDVSPSQPVSDHALIDEQQPPDVQAATDNTVSAASPAQEADQADLMQQSPVEDAATGTAKQSASLDDMEHERHVCSPSVLPAQEAPAADPQPGTGIESHAGPSSSEPAGSVDPTVASGAATSVAVHDDVAELPDREQATKDVVMTPIACESDDVIETDQVASLGPPGPNISAQVPTPHQIVASGDADAWAAGTQDSPVPELTLSQPALQVVDNPLQAVTPVAFGSQPQSQVTASPAPGPAAMAQSMAAAIYGSRSPRPRRTSVHVTAAAECARSPRVTGTFSVGRSSAHMDRASQPTIVLQPSPLRQDSMPQRVPSGTVAGQDRTAPASPVRDFVHNHPIVLEEQPATFQPTPMQVSAMSNPRNAPNSIRAGAAVVQGSIVQQAARVDPVAFMHKTGSVLANAPVSIGPTSAGPQWPAHTPILHDEGDAAAEEGIPAWSSDEGSAIEIAGASGNDAVPEDELPFCDERAGTNVVDMHELEPHETPSPLPEGIWSQFAEQAAEAELGGHPGLPADAEGKRSTSSTPKFCEGDVGASQDFSQPVSRMPTMALPLMDSQQTVRSPLAECDPGDAEVAGTSQEGLNAIMEDNSQSVQPGAVLSPVEVDAEEQASEEEAAQKNEPDTVPTNTEASGQVDAADAKPEAVAGTSATGAGKGGILAQIRSRMLAQKAAAIEKESKPTKQPIAALAKAAKVKQEQQKVQEEREARRKALEKERAVQKQKAPVPAKQPAVKETRIPTTPTARKVLQDMKKTQAVAPGANVLIPACKTPGAFPPSTLHNNVNATPRAQAAMVARMAGTATPRKWRAPTPGPQYPITPEDELEDSEDDESCEARERKAAKFQAPWATSDKLKHAVKQQRYTNPEAIFGTFEPSCNLMEMMAPIQSEKEEFKYTVKRKSRNWGADAITQTEIDSFSRKKGYHQIRDS